MLAAVLLFPMQAGAISAHKAILLDADTGRALYEKDADSRSLIASTTKIMTALIVCEQCNVLDRMRIPKEAVGIEGSSIYLREGEVLTIQELLYGMMLHSGNDAAVALAIYCGGTVEGFAGLMNDKARQLGLTGTHSQRPGQPRTLFHSPGFGGFGGLCHGKPHLCPNGIHQNRKDRAAQPSQPQ